MAIKPGDLEQKRAEFLNERRESHGEEIAILEAAIDSAIARNYKKITRGWFRKTSFIKAQFTTSSLGNEAVKILNDLRTNDIEILNWLWQKYGSLGWKVKFCPGADEEFSFSRLAIEPARENGALTEKTRRIAELKAEIAQTEAEIQMLTESPNSRDPLLLPQTAGK